MGKATPTGLAFGAQPPRPPWGPRPSGQPGWRSPRPPLAPSEGNLHTFFRSKDGTPGLPAAELRGPGPPYHPCYEGRYLITFFVLSGGIVLLPSRLGWMAWGHTVYHPGWEGLYRLDILIIYDDLLLYLYHPPLRLEEGNPHTSLLAGMYWKSTLPIHPC